MRFPARPPVPAGAVPALLVPALATLCTTVLSICTGCSGHGGSDGFVGLPPENTSSSDGGATTGDDGGSDTGWNGAGVGGGPAAGDDDRPAHSLALSQVGTWTLSPPGGPYESMSGTLVVTEVLDGNEAVPSCTATFALTGTALDTSESCSGCQAAFEVLHYLAQDGATLPGTGGDTASGIDVPGLAGCMATDLPADQETWVLGLAGNGHAISRRLGTSAWQPWYQAEQAGASVQFSWTATVGVDGDTGMAP